MELFFNAYMQLSSCRPLGFGALGQIPWTAVIQWADVNGLDERQRDDLVHYIRAMDAEYLTQVNRRPD